MPPGVHVPEDVGQLGGAAPRTYGDGLSGATVKLRGVYELHGDVASRLLDPPASLRPITADRERAPAPLPPGERCGSVPGEVCCNSVCHTLLWVAC